MADGFDKSTDRLTYKAGHTLIWRVSATSSVSAAEIAREMGELADAHALGEWGASPAGVGDTLFYFDLTLEEDADTLMILLTFGTAPEVY